MKIIHCADLHLSSPIKEFSGDIAKKIKTEVRNAFSRLVTYAKTNGVSVILLAGDVFDEKKAKKDDINFFYKVIEENADIHFLYLRGNHDQMGEEREFPNLKKFSSEWQKYTYGDVVIAGIEIAPENNSSYYATLSLDAKKKNIVMLHGQVGGDINIVKLRDKNIDYLALGHIHQYGDGEVDRRGRYAYSGCLQGRGFDETGVKGFILLTVEDKVFYEFIPFSEWNIETVQLDVGGLSDSYSISRLAEKEIPFQKDFVYRIELVGEVDAEVEMDGIVLDLERSLGAHCAHVRVKDRTKKKIDYTAYDGDNSLKGEFVRTVRASEEHTEEEKAQIIAYGLKALAGREVDA